MRLFLPRMQMLYDHDRIPILNIVEVVGLGSGDFPDDRHLGSRSNGRWVEKLLLDREKTPL